MSNFRKINTKNAPAAVGPYSQALAAGGFGFCSGQIGLDSKTNELVGGGIEAQTTQALKNLKHVLTAAGCTLKDVVRTDIFLINMGDFSKVNKIYEAFFVNEPKPARQTVEVSALPKNAMVEISAIAFGGKDEQIG